MDGQCPGQRQIKQFLEKQAPENTKESLSNDKKAVKKVVGVLTGRCSQILKGVVLKDDRSD